jgi:cytochrome c oxidase subunit 4
MPMSAHRGSAASVGTYVRVLIALLLLTVLTVGISFLDLPGSWHLGLGLAIAACKATLVALIFMHLLYSQAATRAVIVVTLFWLVGVLLALTLSDYLTRDSLQMPQPG